MAASPSELTEMRLDSETIAAVDRSDLLADVAGLPEHLRDALWKVESAQLKPWDSPGGLVVAGMGGSAVGGVLARAMLGDHASRPMLASRAYGLPAWTTPDTTVLCASYSGNTEETLACYEAAGALGAPRRGHERRPAGRARARRRRPRDPGRRWLSAARRGRLHDRRRARGRGLCGAGPRMGAEIDVAADHLEQLVVEWGADGAEDSRGQDARARAVDSVPVIAGSGLTQPIAYRWKTQFNENAKIPAFAHELPELDHNEIVGWQGAAVARAVRRDLPRRRRHASARQGAHRADAGADRRPGDGHVRDPSRGHTAVERVFSLVLLGDLVSLYVAVLRGIDPTPVELIETLKQRLAGSG